MQTYTTTVIGNKKFKANDFILELEKPEVFSFKAGQFVMLHNNGTKKAFSIASPPSQKTIDFLIKKNESGKVSPFLYNAKEGDRVTFSGPYGKFVIGEGDSDVVFIAAGVGLAPQRCMLIDSLENNPTRKVTLIFGFRHNFFFEEELKELERKYNNFNLHTCCTRPWESWEGLRGRVTEHLTKIIKSSKGKSVYLTGPKEMMEDTKKILFDELKFNKEQVHIEPW